MSEDPKIVHLKTKAKLAEEKAAQYEGKRLSCSFNAKWLWPMKAVIDYARRAHPLRFFNGHVGVQPAKSGGVLISVFSGHAGAVIHDPDGHTSGPVTLDIPDSAFDACRPKEPVTMRYCGDVLEYPLPEWTMPGQALFLDFLMLVQPKTAPPEWHTDAMPGQDFLPALCYQGAGSRKEHHPGRDYHISEGLPAEWVKPLTAWRNGKMSGGSLLFNPDVPALLSGFVDVMARDERGVRVQRPTLKHWLVENGPALTTANDHPEFLGFWMPMALAKHADEPAEFTDIPAHFMEVVTDV